MPHLQSIGADKRSGDPDEGGLKVHLFARPEELAALLPLIAEAHAESPFARYAFSEAKTRERVLAVLSSSGRQAGFYVTHRGRVVGLAGAAVGPYYLSDEGVVATCLAFFVAGSVRKSLLGARVAALLLRTMKGWAVAKGASMLIIHGTDGRMRRMARGARPIGINVSIPLGG